MTADLARIDELAQAGDLAAFCELVGILRSGPADEAGKAARTHFGTAVPAERLLALLLASRVREGRAYEADAPRPHDYRSRLLVETLLAMLGQRRHEPARALLVELLAHPVHEIRLYAVHGLGGFGDAAAIDALLAALPVLTSTPRSVALRLILAHDHAHAAARLAPLLTDPAVADALLDVLWRDAYGHPSRGECQGWIDDPAFVALAVRTLHATTDKRQRTMMRELLAKADKALVAAAKRAAGPAPRPVKPVTTSLAQRTRLLEQARAQLAPICDALPAIVARLRELGYRFVVEPLAKPPRTIRSQLTALERDVGPLPATVRAFYERVGHVDLRGTHPDWPRTGHVELVAETAAAPPWQTDPLVVWPLSVAQDALEDRDAEEAFDLPLIPEPLAKAGFSAGPGYTVRCGEPMVLDPALDGAPAGRTFLTHLERALAWTGLPGVETITDLTTEWRTKLRR